MLRPLSEQENIDASRIKTGSYYGHKVIMVRKTPTEATDTSIQLGKISELVSGAYDIRGIILDPDGANIPIDRRSLDTLFVIYLFAQDPEAAEEKVLQIIKKRIKEYQPAEAGILCHISGKIFPEKNAKYTYYLARILDSVGELQSAEELYRRSILEQRDNYWLYYRLAFFLEKCGREKESVDVLTAAYNNYSLKKSDRNPIEISFSYVLEELINNPHIGRLKRKTYSSYWEREKKAYTDCPEIYVYDELEDTVNGMD